MKRLSGYILLILLLWAHGAASGQALSVLPESGVYADTFSVVMQGSGTYTIHYTLNGNRPTASDKIYISPIPLTEKACSRSDIFKIRNCPDTIWNPCDEVEKIIVVRAALFDADGNRQSDIKTAVYVIDRLLDRHIKLPIVSICLDSLDLFDYDSGIFVPGVHYDSSDLFFSGNYCQRGQEWEREANLTVLVDGAAALNQTCGVRIHGGKSRCYPQKGFSLYARKEYGSKRFDAKLFDENDLTSYKRLVLRPWMASWSGTGVEDWLCQQMAAQLNCDHLSTRPVVLFLNGEYWGIYYLQEKPDEHYIEDHYGIDKDNVNLLSNWGNELESGSAASWNNLYDWLEAADLSNEDDYRYFASKVDIDALLDYMLLQVFISNVDWPANNVRHWNASGRKWRWIFFDGDAALHHYRSNQVVLDHITCNDPEQNYPTSAHATLFFRRLLANDGFRQRSVDRFYKIVHHYMGDSRTLPLLDSLTTLLQTEIRPQKNRFGTPVSKITWKTDLKTIRNYLQSRTRTMVDDYARHIGLDPSDITVTLYPNPSMGAAALRYETDCGGVLTFSIYSADGRLLSHVSRDLQIGENLVPLPPMPQGVYIIQIRNTGTTLRWLVL